MTRLKNKKRKSKRHEIAHKKLLIKTINTLGNAIKLLDTQQTIMDKQDIVIGLQECSIKSNKETAKMWRRTVIMEVGFIFVMGVSNILIIFQAPIMTFLTKLFLIL